MIVDEVCEIVSMSFSKDTCYPNLRDKWTNKNKALGQCAITALVLNDFLGGKIMRCESESGSHYYNLINDNIVDLTFEQFLGEIPLYSEGCERTRKYLLENDDTRYRYTLLANLVKQNMSKNSKIRKMLNN